MAKKKRRGPPSLFHGKVRKPVTLTLTAEHHKKVKASTERLGITRADLIGLLIDKYADSVTKDYPTAYTRLRFAVEELGGTLEHYRKNEPVGGTWVLRFGDKCLAMPSEQAKRYPLLDACYELKDGIAVSKTWEDYKDEINPNGLAELFRRFAEDGVACSPRQTA